MGKYTAPKVAETDIIQAMAAIREDTGCECRLTLVVCPSGDALEVTATAYTNHGAPVGVARTSATWSLRTASVLGVALGALHRLYWEAMDKANGAPVERYRSLKKSERQ